MKLRRKLAGVSIAMVVIGVGVAGFPLAPATASTEPDAPYVYQLESDGGEVSLKAVQSTAENFHAELVTVDFDGESGKGRVVVLDGDTNETIEWHANELFDSVNAEVPPITGGLVHSDTPIATGAIEVDGAAMTVTQVDMPKSPTPTQGAAIPPAGQPGDSSRQMETSAVVNDWSSWFPSDWRAEGWNMNRCTNFSNGVCKTKIQLASLKQTIQWSDGHSPALWPSTEWGFEFGVSLSNYSFCDDDPDYTPGYWLNPGYYEWATDVNASAYLDDNRAFDTCGRMSQEMGIRSPERLFPGNTYTFVISAPRNQYRTESAYSAQFQAVHDDCYGPWDYYTDCMGLNQNVAWPFGGHQSETVVNVTRFFQFPRCARMHDKWKDPVEWGNGSAKQMPAPLNYSDSCFANDW